MRILRLVAVTLACASCGGASPPPPSASNGGPTACRVVTGGPLVAWTLHPTPAPPPVGGPIQDGEYDLVQMVAHEQTTPLNPRESPSMRAVFRFHTTERAANLAQGELSVKADVPPSSSCSTAPFAAVQTELRTVNAQDGRTSRQPYTANGDLLYLHVGAKSVWVFRRRH